MANERPKYEMMALSAKESFLAVVADEKRWTKEAMFAIQILRNNATAFEKVEPDSIKNAVTNLALTGATLNPALAQAYLVPRGNKCCLDISYRGLVKIAVDSGSVLDVDATVVNEKDVFDYEMGLNPRLIHKPSLEPDPGKPIFVYAVAVLTSGLKKFIVLNMKEIEKVRATSKAKFGPWVDWTEEMMRKTAVKKLYKLLPQSDSMGTAIAIVNEQEGLVDQRAEQAQIARTRFTPPTLQPSTVITEEESPYSAEAGEQEISPEELEKLRLEEIKQFGTDSEKKEAGLFDE